MPLPVNVPAPLTTTPAAGVKVALAFTVRVPTTLKFVLAKTAAFVFEMVKLLNVVTVVPPIVWAAVPFNVTVPLPRVKAPLFVKFPFTFSAKLLPETLRVPAEISKLPFNVVATPKLAVLPVAVIVRLLYVVIAAGNVEFAPVTFHTIVPAPGVNVWLVVVQDVRICRVPPLVISIALPATYELTAVTLRVLVPPTGQLSVPTDVFPTTRVPYARLFAALSNVHVPFILKLSPATGSGPPHFVASLKLPGPVKVLLAANAVAPQIKKNASTKSVAIMNFCICIPPLRPCTTL